MEDFGILAVGIVLFFSLLLVGVWLPLSILWAPFAALLSARKAHLLGLAPAYFGLVGALYSAALFLPWIYLMFRLSGKEVPTPLIVVGYSGVSLIWLLSLLITYSFLDGRSEQLAILTVLGSIVLMAMSLTRVFLSYGRLHIQEGSPNERMPYTHSPSDFWYIAPFGVTFAQALILAFSVWYVVFSW